MAKNDTKTVEKELTPEELFSALKAKKEIATHESLQQIYDASLELGTKYKRSGQITALKKVLYVLETIEKEKQLVDLGINRFIYRDDIDFYIDNRTTNSRPIKIIELARYSREIPDEIVDTVEKVKDIFDEFYILYTDYTGKEEKRIAAEKRSTDPILFGVFIDQDARLCNDRFYYLGDWEDEYCDLTLDKMLSSPLFLKREPLHYAATPATKEELRNYLDAHKEKISFNGNMISFQSTMVTPSIPLSPRKRFIDKVKSVFSRLTK